MSDMSEYSGAAAANAAATTSAALLNSTGNLTASTFNFKNTKKLANFQNEMNIENWNRQNEYNEKLAANYHNQILQSARNAGLNPAAALGGPNFSQQVGAIPSPSLTNSGSTAMSPDFSFLSQLPFLKSQISKTMAESRKLNADAEAQERENMHTRTIDDRVSELMNELFPSKDGHFEYYNVGDLMAKKLMNEYDLSLDQYKIDKVSKAIQDQVVKLQKDNPDFIKALSEKVIAEYDSLVSQAQANLAKAGLDDKNQQLIDEQIQSMQSNYLLDYIDKMSEDFTFKDLLKFLTLLLAGPQGGGAVGAAAGAAAGHAAGKISKFRPGNPSKAPGARKPLNLGNYSSSFQKGAEWFKNKTGTNW